MNTKDNGYLGFIQLNRSSELLNLLHVRHTAYVLLTVIALRARRTSEQHFDDLRIGEALIGDHHSYGVTENVYRADKKFLEKYGLATFKSTNKGTIARIINTTIFNINAEETTSDSTTYQQPHTDQDTTNNKEKNSNKNTPFKGKRNPIMEDESFRKLMEVYHRGDDSAVRRKMSLGPLLENRYPTWKFQREWDEANSVLKGSPKIIAA